MSDRQRQSVPAIIRSVGTRLMQFIRARVPAEADAEDILQDVWGKLLETLDEGPIDQVTSWLYAVTRNRIVDGYRKPKTASLEALTARSNDDSSLDHLELLPTLINSAKNEQWRDEFWQALQTALAELPADQRQTFLWHEIEGLSFEDIAEITGEKINTLLSRKRYAVLHLRKRLAPLLNEPDSTHS